jgi:hypothetical protein
MSSFFSPCKRRCRRKFTPFWQIKGTCTIVCYRQKLGGPV